MTFCWYQYYTKNKDAKYHYLIHCLIHAFRNKLEVKNDMIYTKFYRINIIHL